MDIMRQFACLVLNPIMVYSDGILFNCTIFELLMEQFDTMPNNVDTLNICMKEFGSDEIMFDELLPQLLMEQFDTLHIQCRHIEHMH